MLRHLSLCSTAGRPLRPAHSGGRIQTQEIEALFPVPSKRSLSVANHKRISRYPRAIDRGLPNPQITLHQDFSGELVRL